MERRWENRLYNYVNQAVSSQQSLDIFLRSENRLQFNREQREIVRILGNPTHDIPTRRNSQITRRVAVIPPEQAHYFIDFPNSPIHHKVVPSLMVIGPPGTGKTHVLCSGAILRVFNQNNLNRQRSIIKIYICTFSNSGAYRIYEKMHEIASLADTSDYYTRIKLVQSRAALGLPALTHLENKIQLNREDFTISNYPRSRDIVNDVLIFIGTTDSLAILNSDNVSRVRIHDIIYDEASQLTVPQFFQVIPTHNIQSISIFGDDAQLPPVTTLTTLGLSAMTYLQGNNVYQNIRIPRNRIRMLTRQYRMHPAIAQLTRQIVRYDREVIPDGVTTRPDYILPENEYNTFKDTHPNTSKILLDILSPTHPLVILDTSEVPNAEDEIIGTSRRNRIEADIAGSLYRYFREAYPFLSQSDIILTAPYREQINLLRDRSMNAGTVHQFQGQEATVVIYSLTFASINTKSEFFTNYELMYVGLSRAQRKLIIIGNKSAMNFPSFAMNRIRNAIFNFKYSSGQQGYPHYPIDPVLHVKLNDIDLNSLLFNN